MYLRDRIYFGGRQVTNYLYTPAARLPGDSLLRAWYDRRRPGAVETEVETLGELLSNETIRGKPFTIQDTEKKNQIRGVSCQSSKREIFSSCLKG